ncbi:MAG: hypothetical protein O2924_00200 [Chloroflexi bacterium]|nr:hypothetical protein [Chloroflexota bacterium]MQC16635.1 hypothetical protein [Chloroflexota bacterium]MQC47585.1 hypothetical protein [Chloroflexota bacterium]
MSSNLNRQWLTTTVALLVLVIISFLENATVLAVAAVGVLIVGLVLLPRDRIRMPLLALIAGCLATLGSALFGWDILA